MGEININYKMDPEHEELLKKIYSILYDLNKHRRTPLSDLLISAKNLRAELGISPKTEYTLRNKGVLKGKKLGSKWFYYVSHIMELPGDSDKGNDANE